MTWQAVDLRTDIEACDWHTVDPADVLAHVAGLLERPAWPSPLLAHADDVFEPSDVDMLPADDDGV